MDVKSQKKEIKNQQKMKQLEGSEDQNSLENNNKQLVLLKEEFHALKSQMGIRMIQFEREIQANSKLRTAHSQRDFPGSSTSIEQDVANLQLQIQNLQKPLMTEVTNLRRENENMMREIDRLMTQSRELAYQVQQSKRDPKSLINQSQMNLLNEQTSQQQFMSKRKSQYSKMKSIKDVQILNSDQIGQDQLSPSRQQIPLLNQNLKDILTTTASASKNVERVFTKYRTEHQKSAKNSGQLNNGIIHTLKRFEKQMI
ncbi:UNKNOWN [Stylonychia lemnae]|uniref:Uncharacterized protein n=1 Tax=Stylonychia lemnae TaxID=5949 RepID=A0A078AGD4_STYLE|nr:UNKNOWN [Stylonychia lemnae]|eukprot:CDW80871.1 UNKNOWN [Stylonychia lemnae]